MTTNKLDTVRAKAARMRDVKLEIEDLETQLKDKKSELEKLVQIDLPDLMREIGMDRIGLPVNGNKPAVDVVLQPFYRANIASSWDEARRQAAFAWLIKNHAGDLIKTKIEMAFPRQSFKKAKALFNKLTKQKLNPTLDQSVHSQTLTAWLRERVEAGEIPPLDVIGGHIGQIAVIRDREA